MSSTKLEVRSEVREGGTLVYTLEGSLYGSTTGYGFQEEVRQKIAGGARRIVIDLSAVDRIDSPGIGILVATMWSASQSGARLVLAALSRKVEKVLSIAMLLDHIDHAPTVDEAVARLRQ
jgi:anti-anti-sigma factor